MRRALLLVSIAPAGAIAWACTAFDFPPPSASSDAGGDVVLLDSGTPGPTSFLPEADAARLCAQVFRCPNLGEAIELSIALPVATPATPLSFSGCMDWMAGPVDPARVGLAEQQAMLQSVANASSCDAAANALPVRPVDASACASACLDKTDLEVCSGASAFSVPCQPPLFGESGDCFGEDAGTGAAVCVSAGQCTPGLSCIDAGVAGMVVDCYSKAIPAFTSYDCSLSGRQCQILGTKLAGCVSPGDNTTPCPLDDVKDDCDGTSVRHCAGGATAQTEIACAAVGRSCTTSNAATVARCAGTSDSCTPFDADVNQCSDGGSTISLCIGGRSTSFDCSSIGQACLAGNANATAHCG